MTPPRLSFGTELQSRRARVAPRESPALHICGGKTVRIFERICTPHEADSHIGVAASSAATVSATTQNIVLGHVTIG